MIYNYVNIPKSALFQSHLSSTFKHSGDRAVVLIINKIPNQDKDSVESYLLVRSLGVVGPGEESKDHQKQEHGSSSLPKSEQHANTTIWKYSHSRQANVMLSLEQRLLLQAVGSGQNPCACAPGCVCVCARVWQRMVQSHHKETAVQLQTRPLDSLLKGPLLDLNEGFQQEVVQRGEGPLPHHQGQALLPVLLSPLFHCRVCKANAVSPAASRHTGGLACSSSD